MLKLVHSAPIDETEITGPAAYRDREFPGPMGKAAPGEAIRVPERLQASIDQIVEEVGRRTGEGPTSVRKTVERLVLEIGVKKYREEMGLP